MSGHGWAAPPRAPRARWGRPDHVPERAADVAVVLALVALAVYQALALPPAEIGSRGRLGFAAAHLAAALLLLLRRHVPLVALAAVVGLVSAGPALGVPLSNTGLFAVALACYSQACWTRHAPAWLGWSLTLAVPVGVTMALPPEVRLGFLRDLGATVAGVEAMFALASYAGHLQRSRRRVAAALGQRELRLRDQPTALAELDVAEERERIARDLQQIVVHAVEQVRQRLEGAVRAARRAGPEAERAIDEVAAAGRAALVEMRRLLGVLRVDPGVGHEAGVDVERLQAQAATAGVALTLDLPAVLDEQPAAVRNAVRRFVEVAVGTAVRFQGTRELRVRVAAMPGALRLRSEPLGAPTAPPTAALPPWDAALSALAERLRVLGGQLDVGWLSGRPVLDATVPLDADVDLEPVRDDRQPLTAGRTGAASSSGALWHVPPSAFLPLSALVVGTIGVVELLTRPASPHLPVPEQIVPGVVVMAAFAATLLVRRRWPLGGFAVVLALTLLIGLSFVRKSDAYQLVVAMYLFTIASRYPARVAAAATAAALVTEIPHMIRVDWSCLCVVLVLAVALGAAATGRVAQRLDVLNRALRTRVQEVTQQRDREARLAVSEERRRIAREMHDLVAHRLSILVLQAEAAADLIQRDPARAQTMLTEVDESLHALAGELRALLGHVTAEEAVPGDLFALTRDAERAGLTIELLDAAGVDATPSARAAVYRIVQEALTNAGKHAPGAHVTVRLHRDGTALHVEVRNSSPTGRAPRSSVAAVGAGHGLLGIRERVLAFSGSLDTRAEPDGGFTLRASLREPARV